MSSLVMRRAGGRQHRRWRIGQRDRAPRRPPVRWRRLVGGTVEAVSRRPLSSIAAPAGDAYEELRSPAPGDPAAGRRRAVRVERVRPAVRGDRRGDRGWLLIHVLLTAAGLARRRPLTRRHDMIGAFGLPPPPPRAGASSEQEAPARGPTEGTDWTLRATCRANGCRAFPFRARTQSQAKRVVLVRFAIAEDARSRLGNALPCLLLLRRIGCSPDGAGSRLSLCVLHEPDAGHHHCEQDDPGDEEPHGHLLSAPQRGVERADCKDRGHPEAGEQGLLVRVREPQDHRENKGEEGGERD